MIGKFLCWLTRNHIWKRNRTNMLRSCKRCGLVVPIKKREVK